MSSHTAPSWHMASGNLQSTAQWIGLPFAAKHAVAWFGAPSGPGHALASGQGGEQNEPVTAPIVLRPSTQVLPLSQPVFIGSALLHSP